MDFKSSNVTVSLIRCDDVNINKKVHSKDTIENHTTTEVKRSLRLSRKRIFQDESISKNNDQSNKEKKCSKNKKCNKAKSEKPIANKSNLKKLNNQSSTSKKLTKNNLTNSDLDKKSDEQHSPNTTVGNNKMTLPLKTTSKTLKKKISTQCTSTKKMSDIHDTNKNDIPDVECNVDFVECNRKRGRPLSTSKINKVNSCSKKVIKQKTQNLAIIVEKLYNINETESSEVHNDNTILSECKNKSSEVEKKWSKDNLLTLVKSNVSSSLEATGSSETILTAPGSTETILTATASEKSSASGVIAVDNSQTHLKKLESDIFLLSKRFNIPFETLRNITVKKALPIYHEKFSKSVNSSMLIVSPIVNINPNVPLVQGNHDIDYSDINYKIEPVRVSEIYEKTNLRDCMNELIKTMPSWNLCIVSNPSRYVIYQMSINTYGVPMSNKSIVLDKHFRGSVYINQALEYKYCKPYSSAREIIDLIKELDSFS